MQKQNTLAASFSLQGKGLHSGLNIEVSFNPAPENHGYKIKRVDLPEQPRKRNKHTTWNRYRQKRYTNQYDRTCYGSSVCHGC